jgi:hypothetical protein
MLFSLFLNGWSGICNEFLHLTAPLNKIGQNLHINRSLKNLANTIREDHFNRNPLGQTNQSFSRTQTL